MYKKTSIYDIAKRLDIAASTVSRALNGHPSISESVRNEVFRVSKEMDYQPNKMAKNLKQGKTMTVGVVIPQLNRHFFASAINGIEEMASRSGYNVLIYQTQNEVLREQKAMRTLNRSVVDGLLVSVVADRSDYAHFYNVQKLGMPVIFFDRYPLADGFKRVCMDDAEASRSVVDHLVSLGRRKIFHFSGRQYVSIWRERTRGYLSKMEELDIAIAPEWIFSNTHDQRSGMEAAGKMLREKNIPEAVYASSDHSLLGAMHVFRQHGYRIPEDVAMVGCGDELFSNYVNPSITTVDQHPYEMGKEAFRQLERLINGDPVPQEVIIPHSLIIRESTMGHAGNESRSASKQPGNHDFSLKKS